MSNYDLELERHYHPENFQGWEDEEAEYDE